MAYTYIKKKVLMVAMDWGASYGLSAAATASLSLVAGGPSPLTSLLPALHASRPFFPKSSSTGFGI